MSAHTSASADFGLPPVALPTSWVSPKTRKAVRPFIDLAAFSALIHLPSALPPNKIAGVHFDNRMEIGGHRSRR